MKFPQPKFPRMETTKPKTKKVARTPEKHQATPPNWVKPGWSNERWIGVIHLSPEEFLSKVPKIVYYEPSYRNIKSKLSKGKEMDMPNIQVGSDGKFLGHEGRHRALVARDLGIKKIPVAIYWFGGYRGSPQAKKILKKHQK